MTAAPMRTIDPTWTWGSSAQITLKAGAGGLQQSAQLAQISLPEPAVCSLYFQATARISAPDMTVGTLTLNLTQGLGRVTIPRQISFSGQPSDFSPVEWTMPFIPLHSLQVDVEALGNFDGPGEGQIDIQMYFVLAPITRIPQQIQKLQFGMALPGEADALDDELRENLEGDSPTAAAILEHEADQRVHGADDDDDDDEPEAAPAWMLDLVDALSQRLRRAPTRAELRKAVTRLKERQARRGR